MTSYNATISEGGKVGDATGFGPGISNLALTDSYKIRSKVLPQVSSLLSDHMTGHAGASVQWRLAVKVLERAKLVGSWSSVAGSYHMSISTKAKFKDLFTHAIGLLIQQRMHISDLLAVDVAMSLVERMGVSDALKVAQILQTHVIEKLTIHGVFNRAFGAMLVERMGFHDILSPIYQAVAMLSEHIAGTDVLGEQLIITVMESDSLYITDSSVLHAIYQGMILESADFVFDVASPGNSVTTWAMNARTGAVTEYQNYDFNSFAKHGTGYIACGDDGLYELIGDRDVVTPIIADMASGMADFAGMHFTSFKAAYLGMRAKGRFYLKLVEGNGVSRTYEVRPKPNASARVNLGKGLRARYFSWELISTGQDFDLDSIEFLPIASTRRV